MYNFREQLKKCKEVEVKKTVVIFHTTRVNNNDLDETEFITFNELAKYDHVYIMKEGK